MNPTRMNLLLKKEEVNTAETGAVLLRSKRDVLLKEFFSTLKFLLSQREGLDNQSYTATLSLVYSLGLEGRERLESMAFPKPAAPLVEVSYKNIWGIKIPDIVIKPHETAVGEESVFLQNTQSEFQNLLNRTLSILPKEIKLKRLGDEMKSTTRKVNSLEKYVIPGLRRQVKNIQEVLEEREREDIFRLKRLKRFH